MTSSDFIKKFQYRKGPTFIEGWQRIDNDDYAGDCNHFALTVLILEEGGWLRAMLAVLTFRAVFWLTYSPSNKLFPRHVVLHYRPKGWIDSTVREWRASPAPHKRILPLLFPWVYLRAAWGWLVSLIF